MTTEENGSQQPHHRNNQATDMRGVQVR
jgi:hypothetical protein